ncbi:MAG: M48 family metalloprotease [Candidatus Bathyarchaeota archaeon]|nr:M48 family metalloprotease [Candidatus Bathyarchaeota archaeon]
MARLAQLKLSMGMAVVLVSMIFFVFLVVIMWVLQLHLVWALIATIIFILIQYLIGPVIVRASTNLRYLRSGEHPWLESAVASLAQKSGIQTPKLAVVPDNTPNAFVFGRTTSDATLAVHEGLLAQLNQDEIRAVLGHELGHIRHKDFLIMTALSSLPLLAFLIFRGTFQAAWISGRASRKKEGGGLAAAMFAIAAVSYVVYIISLLCVMRLSRLREHYADAYSAYVTESPRQLSSALTKITYGLSLSPKPPHGARTFYIGDPALAKQEVQGLLRRKQEYDLDKDGVLDERELELAMEKEAKSKWASINRWFHTHPPTFQRILLLNEIEKEMSSGRYTAERVYTHV